MNIDWNKLNQLASPQNAPQAPTLQDMRSLDAAAKSTFTQANSNQVQELIKEAEQLAAGKSVPALNHVDNEHVFNTAIETLSQAEHLLAPVLDAFEKRFALFTPKDAAEKSTANQIALTWRKLEGLREDIRNTMAKLTQVRTERLQRGGIDIDINNIPVAAVPVIAQPPAQPQPQPAQQQPAGGPQPRVFENFGSPQQNPQPGSPPQTPGPVNQSWFERNKYYLSAGILATILGGAMAYKSVVENGEKKRAAAAKPVPAQKAPEPDLSKPLKDATMTRTAISSHIVDTLKKVQYNPSQKVLSADLFNASMNHGESYEQIAARLIPFMQTLKAAPSAEEFAADSFTSSITGKPQGLARNAIVGQKNLREIVEGGEVVLTWNPDGNTLERKKDLAHFIANLHDVAILTGAPKGELVTTIKTGTLRDLIEFVRKNMPIITP